MFDNVQNITDLIQDITKSKYIEKNFFIHGYTCIDSENWNEKNEFYTIENLFYRYIYAMKYDSNIEFDKENNQNSQIISNLKYSKCGITSKTSNMITSSIEPYNYTELIESYNNQYFYTYIIEIYKKLYLQKMCVYVNKKDKNTSVELEEFKKLVLEAEITKDIFGLEYSKNLEQVLEIWEIYNKLNNEIVSVSKNKMLKKEDKINRWIAIALCFSVIINLITFIILIRIGVS